MKSVVETTLSIPSAPASDPLLNAAPFPFAVELYPLGFPLILETTSARILEAAKESWGSCEKLFHRPPIRVRAGVSGNQDQPIAWPPTFRSNVHLLSITGDGGNIAAVDLKTGFAFSWVTEEVAAQRDEYRYFFLEAMVYSLLSGKYLAAIHAACVERNGRGLLLCGETSAGKSSLAYACARRGWTYVSDDAINIVRGSKALALVGNCFSLRLRPDAPELFPELLHYLARRRPNGKTNLELRPAELDGFKLSMTSRPSRLMFLNRRRGASPIISPINAEEALKRLSSLPPYGPPSLHRAWMRSISGLVKQLTAAEFTYSNLDEAVSRLEEVMDETK
ncbi:MAG: hypothetical protein ABI693_03620 [Bryobacteraceae bacterium]